MSRDLDKSVDELKKMLDIISQDKEKLKQKIQKIFTKLRNTLNNREDDLLSQVDKCFKETYFDEEIIVQSEKLPKMINSSLEKGKKIVNGNNNIIKLNSLINDCLSIEENIKQIISLENAINKCKKISGLKIYFLPEEDEINNFLKFIQDFGQLENNSSKKINQSKEMNKALLNIGSLRKKLDGSLAQITSGPYGLFGVDKNDEIWFREGVEPHKNKLGTSWTKLDGLLKQISCGKYGVWGTNRKNELFYRKSISNAKPKGDSWHYIQNNIKQVSVGCHGVWCLDVEGNILFREGISAFEPMGNNWAKIKGNLSYISDGYYGVWGLNDANEVLYRTGINENNQKGEDWIKFDGKMKKISVGIYGVFGLNEKGDIFYRKGINDFNFIGNEWIQFEGKFKDISSGELGLFGANDNYEIFVRSEQQLENLTDYLFINILSKKSGYANRTPNAKTVKLNGLIVGKKYIFFITAAAFGGNSGDNLNDIGIQKITSYSGVENVSTYKGNILKGTATDTILTVEYSPNGKWNLWNGIREINHLLAFEL